MNVHQALKYNCVWCFCDCFSCHQLVVWGKWVYRPLLRLHPCFEALIGSRTKIHAVGISVRVQSLGTGVCSTECSFLSACCTCCDIVTAADGIHGIFLYHLMSDSPTVTWKYPTAIQCYLLMKPLGWTGQGNCVTTLMNQEEVCPGCITAYCWCWHFWNKQNEVFNYVGGCWLYSSFVGFAECSWCDHVSFSFSVVSVCIMTFIPCA